MHKWKTLFIKRKIEFQILKQKNEIHVPIRKPIIANGCYAISNGCLLRELHKTYIQIVPIKFIKSNIILFTRWIISFPGVYVQTRTF